MAWGGIQYRFTLFPPIGVYIAIVAVVAIMVTLWPPENRWSKAAWIAIFFALGFLEINNLYRDRAQHDQEQEKVRREEREAFQAIANGITTEIQTSQKQFDASVAKLNSISSLTVESNNSATGGDSYCYLAFLGMIELPKISNQFVIINLGKYPLYDIDIRIVDLTRLDSIGFPIAPDRHFHPNEIQPGTSWHPAVQESVIPFMGTDRNKFNIFFIARNGAWNEEFRLEKVNGHWAQAVRVQGGFFSQKKRIFYETVGADFPLAKLDWVPSTAAKSRSH